MATARPRPTHPRSGRPEPGRGPAEPSPRAPDADAALILVVDDFGGAREIYSRVLRSSRFRVVEAADGTEALEKGLSLKPDLIVLDLALPGMDGLDLIGRFKADPRTRNTRIVVVSGAGYVDGERRARQAGCDAYLVKPCVPERLLSVVRDLLGPGFAPPDGANA